MESLAVEGQSVSPDTVLFSIQPPAQPGAVAAPAAPAVQAPRYSEADAKALLDGINIQIAAAESATLPRNATGQQIAARLAQLANLRRQRDAAEREVQLASTPPRAEAPPPAPSPASPPAPSRVTAGMAGLLWSVLATPGATVAAGAPLAQIADCDRQFMAIPANGRSLRPGQTVSVRFGQQPPVRARVRADAPADGPPGRVQLDLAAADIRAATGESCAVGRTVQVTPRP